MRHSVWVMVLSLVACTLATGAEADSTTDAIRARGKLLCGTREDTAGFARHDEKGEFSGLEIDMCRAVAAAIFGNADKVRYVPLDVARHFFALRSGEVDVLASGTTLTLTRETTLGFDFVATYYFDSQAFMVPRKLGKRRARDLDGASVCVHAGTMAADDIEEYFRVHGMTFKPVLFEKVADQRNAFFSGGCDVYAGARSSVHVARLAYAPNPNDFFMLPESPSWESLSLIVRRDDQRFSDVVRWAFLAMLVAEEHGVSSSNVDEMLESGNPTVQRLLGVTPGMGKALGLDEKWAYNIIKQVGNYAESYDRNVGSGSALKIPRGVNELASQGGMQYAAPFR